MSFLSLTDVRTYYASVDLTGYSNKVSMSTAYDKLDATTFASAGNREYQAGLATTSFSLDGYWAAGDLTKPDDAIFASFASNTNPLTVVPTSGAVGSLCYLTRTMTSDYKLFGADGDLVPFSFDTAGNWPLVRGQILHPQGTARTASGNGTGVQLGAVPLSQSLYINLHVLSVSGTTPSLTVTVQDSVDNTFGTPHTTATFTAATAVGGQTLKVAGPITNTWFRPTWTISGTSPSFLFAVSAGIAV